jgi:transaldolase
MKFFIDTANLDEIREAASMGLLDGVTTNPSLMAKENADRDTRIKEICNIVDGPVSAEVVSVKTAGMVREGKALAKLAPNVVVKIPMTVDGIKATKALTESGIMVNMTLVFSPLQALLAAKAGASFVSPFVGRLDDQANVGMELVDQIVTIYNNYGYETEVLVASIRNPVHVLDSALMGADVATMPFKVIKQLSYHPLTDKGLQAFLDDYKKSTAKKRKKK